MRYHHRQFGAVTLAALGLGALAAIVGASASSQSLFVTAPVTVICLVAAALFSSLSIEVANHQLRWWFGLGWPAGRVALDDIATAEVTRVRIWEGWGIHLTTRGWLYNVSGFGAVAITLKSGKQFVLGSDQPEQLAAAISSRT